MITRIRKQLFSVRHTYTNPLDRQRAQVLLFLNLALVLITLASIVVLTIPSFLNSGQLDVSGLFSSLVVVIASWASYQLIQSGRLKQAIWIVLLAITLGTLSAIVFSGGDTPSISTSLIIFLPVPIVVAGVLLNRRGLIMITLLVLVVVTVSAIAESTAQTATGIVSANGITTDFIAIVLSILSILVVLLAFLGTLQNIANESFEIGAQRQRISKMGLELGLINNETQLLDTAITKARQIFGQRFIEIYLLNEEGNLTLPSGGGQRRTAIRSIDTNIVAEAARSRMLLTTSLQDDPARHTHMAASTSHDLAVPVMVNNNVMGVLDIQDVNAFSHNEQDTLQQLADQIALALQRVRIETDLQARVDDQEGTINRLQTQLADFSRSQQQNVNEVWGSYIQGRGRQAIGYNLDQNSATPVHATDLPGALANTLKTGQLEVTTQGNEQIVNVPIKFRDTNLGAMSFSIPAGQSLSDRQIEVATTVAERLALALENTRLFEQSQSQALRERKASEVSTALIGATDVRVVLNMAAEQFKDALGAVNTRIFIQPETLMEPLAQTQGDKN